MNKEKIKTLVTLILLFILSVIGLILWLGYVEKTEPQIDPWTTIINPAYCSKPSASDNPWVYINFCNNSTDFNYTMYKEARDVAIRSKNAGAVAGAVAAIHASGD